MRSLRMVSRDTTSALYERADQSIGSTSSCRLRNNVRNVARLVSLVYRKTDPSYRAKSNILLAFHSLISRRVDAMQGESAAQI